MLTSPTFALQQPFLLAGLDRAWRVQSGSLALFVCRLKDGRPVGARFPACTAQSGDVVFGVAADQAAGLLAVPLEATVFEEVEASASARRDWFDKVCLPASLEVFLEHREQEDRRRIVERHEFSIRANAGVMHRLAHVASSSGNNTIGSRPGSPLLAAAQAVGEAINVVIRPGETLEDIAEASLLRVRRVQLAEGWWKKDCGSLVGFRVDTGEAVALVQVQGRHYDLIDPLLGTRTRVDAAVATTIRATAYRLYRVLGRRAGTWSVVRFALAPYRRDLLRIAALGVCSALLTLAIPEGAALILDHALPEGQPRELWQVGFAMAFATLGAAVVQLAQAAAIVRVQTAVTVALETGIWDRLLRLTLSFFALGSGDVRARATGIRQLQHQLSAESVRAVAGAVFSSLNVLLMFYYSPALACVALVCGLLVACAGFAAQRRVQPLQERKQQLEGTLSGLLAQMIAGIVKLRVAGAEQRAFSAWAAVYADKQAAALRIRRITDTVRVMNSVAPLAITAVIFAVASAQLASPASAPSLGSLIAFYTAMGAFLVGMTTLSEFAASVDIRATWARTRSLLDAEMEVKTEGIDPGRITGQIVFENVSFRYCAGGRPTVENVSFRAEPGECIALVGASGSGKSTILNLLLGFESPQAGRITIDGHPLANLRVSALRKQFGVVTQDTRLTAGTIFENITVGSNRTFDEAWEAARLAAIADEIEQMPMGMQTLVSEGGTNVSGGQRQRLLVARALVNRPAVLILDEATSALDNRTQAIVTENLNRLRCTRIIVAHRPTTLQQADRIYVLDRGRMVKSGSFDEIYARCITAERQMPL